MSNTWDMMREEELFLPRGSLEFVRQAPIVAQVGRHDAFLQQPRPSSNALSVESMHQHCNHLSLQVSQTTAANHCWTTLFDLFPATPFQVHYDYAKYIEQKGADTSTSNVIAAYERALAVMTEPTSLLSLDAMNRLGLLWLKQSRPHIAIDIFRQSLRWHPFECALYGNLASAYLELGNVTAALAAATTSIVRR
ncbi:hypothetical protein AaE_002404 [Aphanomyces astaci]|uniref:Uncharacterized protein n=1 Tax=Aphanomyces astaci TaxID=112090 RepID=A0A6A5APX2_APHAT|nr:hypothetical protein AaE_002404 [Aphanomyces astaci]